MNSRFIAALFVASLALAASMEVDEYNTDVAYAEATSFVQSYLEAQVFDGKKKDESACAKVADDSIQEIKDECKKLQGIVNSAATKNAHCCADSMGPVRKAVKRYNDSKSSGKKCRKELESLRNSSVSFSGVKFKNLKEGKCGHFFTGGSFASVHKKVKAKSLRCNQIDGQTKAFKREWDLAVDEACRGRSRCNARAKKAYTTAFNTAKKACSSAKNKKAWTRAKHMKCVLQGKTLAQCRTGSPPKIQSRAMTKRNCNCKCSGSSDVIVGSKPFRLRRSYVKSTSITTHRDFKLEFTIKPHGRVNGWNSVLHFSAGRGSNGSRIPAIWFHGGSTRMHVRMGRHGNANDGCDPRFQLPLHKWSHVTVKVVGHQLTVNVDGKRACYSNNYSGHHAYKSQRNVRLYLSDPWYPAANASIKNLYYGTGRFGGSSKRGACDGSVGKKAGGNKGGKPKKRACTTKETMGKTFYAFENNHCYRIVVGKSLDQDYQTRNKSRCNAAGFRKSVSIGKNGGINSWWENGTRAGPCKGKNNGRNQPRRAFLKLSQGASKTHATAREGPTCNYHINVQVASCTAEELNVV